MAYIRRSEFKDHRIWKDKGRWAGFIAYANDTVNNPEVPIDEKLDVHLRGCLLYTSPSPRDCS